MFGISFLLACVASLLGYVFLRSAAERNNGEIHGDRGKEIGTFVDDTQSIARLQFRSLLKQGAFLERWSSNH